MKPAAASLLRVALVLAVTLAGAVLLPLAGVLAWAWARECGGLHGILFVAYVVPPAACIVALDSWIWRRRLTVARARSAIVLAVAAEWALGLLFFFTQWGC